MVRFEKTRIHPASAALFLVGLYALVGVAYAARAHSADSIWIWVIVAGLAFAASALYQRHVARTRGRAR